MEVKGMKTSAYVEFIEFVERGGSYIAFLEIGWDNDHMVVINFKKHMMPFENQEMRVIASMDST